MNNYLHKKVFKFFFSRSILSSFFTMPVQRRLTHHRNVKRCKSLPTKQIKFSLRSESCHLSSKVCCTLFKSWFPISILIASWRTLHTNGTQWYLVCFIFICQSNKKLHFSYLVPKKYSFGIISQQRKMFLKCLSEFLMFKLLGKCFVSEKMVDGLSVKRKSSIKVQQLLIPTNY